MPRIRAESYERCFVLFSATFLIILEYKSIKSLHYIILEPSIVIEMEVGSKY